MVVVNEQKKVWHKNHDYVVGGKYSRVAAGGGEVLTL